MPSDFPGRPKLLKGAMVEYQSQFLWKAPNVIVFQYNPEQLSRTLTHRVPQSDLKDKGAAREDVQRVEGPPLETISLTVKLDVADQLAEPALHPQIVLHGLHPALAALELLLYPEGSQVLHNRTLASRGETMIASEEVPLVLFVWGASRVLPIRLTSFSVTEQAFDQALNPILAEVQLGMRVLSYTELKKPSEGYKAYLATQAQKELLARLNLANSAEQVIGMLPF